MRARVARNAAVFPLAVRTGVARRAAVFPLTVGAGVARRTVLFQLAVRTGGARRAVVLPLAVRAWVAPHAALFQLTVGAGAAHRADVFPLPVGTWTAHRAAAFHPPVRAPLPVSHYHRTMTTSCFSAPLVLKRHDGSSRERAVVSGSRRNRALFCRSSPGVAFAHKRSRFVTVHEACPRKRPWPL